MKRKRVYTLLAVLSITYIGLVIFLPPDQKALERYHLSIVQLRLLMVTIVLPLLAIWWAAFYGYANFRMYSSIVKNSAEGKAFSVLAKGLGILAISMPVTSILSSIISYTGRVHPSFYDIGRLMNSYIALIFSVTAIVFIYMGTAKLVRTVKGTNKRRYYDLFMLALIILAVLYPYFVFTNSSRNTAEVYGMPDWIIITTIVVPYIYSWYLGFSGTVRLHYYQSSVKGIVYKQSLRYLTLGIAGVIAVSVITQFLVAVSTGLTKLELGSLLALIYVLLIFISVGYVFIAFGSKKLIKIEEV